MRMLRRYRSIMIGALPLGALLGLVTYLITFTYVGWSLIAALQFFLGGIVVAIAAVLGALLAVAAFDDRLRKSAGARAGMAGLGAGIGVILLGVVVSIIAYVTAVSPSGGDLTVIIGMVLAVPAAILGTLMTWCVESRTPGGGA